jgi:hypothetical protein
VSEWVAIRYDEDGWPSHPDEDLPPDGARVEMWRGNGLECLRSRGRVRRHEAQGRPTATIDTSDTLVMAAPKDLPEAHGRAGVVWRLL